MLARSKPFTATNYIALPMRSNITVKCVTNMMIATIDDSLIPEMVRNKKMMSTTIVAIITGINEKILCRYFIASVAEITAVAI